MSRALVLGGTGHIGAHVVRALLSRGYAVRATYRNSRYRFLLDGLPAESLPVDLDDVTQLSRTADGCELVFICAGYYPRWTERRGDAIRRGLAQIHRVFGALRHSRARRIVYTSSAATIAHVPGRASTETDREPWPLTRWPHHLTGFAESEPPLCGSPPASRQVVGWRPLYSTVKIAMEHAVQRYVDEGLPIVIVNPSVCIGEYDAHPFSGRLVLAFAGKRWRLPVYLEHAFNVIYTGDVGLAHVLAAERGVVGERYLLAGEQTTLGDFASQAARIAGVPPPRWRIPLTLGSPQQLDGSKARLKLGLEPTPMEEAIRRAVSWFRHYRYL